MSRVHQGWYEGFCIDHTPLYNEKTTEAYCSWCFKKTIHNIHMDSIFNRVIARKGKIFTCSGCNRPTQHCKKCDEGMMRFGECDETRRCFKCCKLITSWDNPAACIKSLTVRAYCPWCMNLCDHQMKMHHKKGGSKDTYQCTTCLSDTKKCSNCAVGMCLDSSSSSKCVPCKLNRRDIWESNKQRFDQLSHSYSIETGIGEMNRNTQCRARAQSAGLIRPFMLLVSMHPQMRAATAYKLDIPLQMKVGYGDPHAEAEIILFHEKKGLQRRSNGILETLGISTKCNWYQILRRATTDLIGYSTFKSKNADKTFQECADPSSEVLNCLELELLDHIAQRYLHMFPDDVREKAYELYGNSEVYAMFAEMRTEGVDTDAICVMFVGIVISSGVSAGKLSMNAREIQLADFIQYLQLYLQSKTKMGEKVHDAQFAGAQVAFFIARVVVVGTLLQVVSVFIFPPLVPLISLGLLTLGVSLLVAAFVCRSSREISCQAVVLIVFQHFLLDTYNIRLGDYC